MVSIKYKNFFIQSELSTFQEELYTLELARQLPIIIIIIIIINNSNSIDPHKVANKTHWSIYMRKTMYQQSLYRLNITIKNVTHFDN